MATIDEWFDDFVLEHIRRSGRRDFPVPGSDDGDPFWELWESKFRLIGMTEDVARQASIKVCETSDFPNQHLEKLINEAKKIFRATNGGGSPGNDREHAKEQTPEDCECGQSGIVIRFRHLPVRDMKGHNASGAIFNAYCICPMGRWLKSVHSYELRRYFADLAAYPQLQLAEVPWSPEPDNQYRHHPRNWDDMRGCPIVQESLYASDKALLRSGGRIPRLEYKRPPQAILERQEPTEEQLQEIEARRRMLESQFDSKSTPE